jgi:hypothetical protein
MCHCGKLIHYESNAQRDHITQLCLEQGDYVPMISSVNGKTYKVQRHYLALHHIEEHELHRLGFEEWS